MGFYFIILSAGTVLKKYIFKISSIPSAHSTQLSALLFHKQSSETLEESHKDEKQETSESLVLRY